MLFKALVDRKRVPRSKRTKQEEVWYCHSTSYNIKFIKAKPEIEAATEETKEEKTEEQKAEEQKAEEQKEEPKEEKGEEEKSGRKGKRKKEDTAEPVRDEPPPEPHVDPNPIPLYSKVLSPRKRAIYQRMYITFTNDLGYETLLSLAYLIMFRYVLIHKAIAEHVFADATLAPLDMVFILLFIIPPANPCCSGSLWLVSFKEWAVTRLLLKHTMTPNNGLAPF